MPKVSIIIPTYNVADYLVECLQSVINQTLKDIEIICVNDGSTDNSGKILDEYAAKDSRIKVIHKENGGYGKAMNVGMDNATGKYIGIVEPDDYVESNMYEELYNYAEKNNVDFVKADLYYWYSKENKKIYTNCISNKNLYNKIIREFSDLGLVVSTIGNWVGIYQRDFIEKNHIKHLETPGASYQDQGFYYQIIFNAKSAYYINKAFYWYRQDNIASSINNKNKVFCIFDEYKEIEKNLNNKKDKEKYYNLLYFKKYNSCLYNYGKIYKKFKHSFYERLTKEFAQAYYDSKILRKNFNFQRWNVVKKWISDYEKNNQKPNIKIENKIPIVFASDKNYSDYMRITTISLLENKNASTFYDFTFLVPKNFPESHIKQFSKLKEKYSNFEINFIDMGDSFKNNKMQLKKITFPTYYRLKMAQIFPQYKKVIYLDVDTIVLQDLSEYYNIDLSDCYIAGVQAAAYILDTSNRHYYEQNGLYDLSKYINAGATLWNLQKIRNDRITEKLIELSKKNYKSMDQDVINIAFQKHIKILPLKYNLMIKYPEIFEENSLKYNQISKIYGKNNIKDAIKNPSIIHYADKNKPWNNKECFLSNYWHYYAKKIRYKRWQLQKIFSIKNNLETCCKVVTICGIQIKLKSKKLRKKK